MPHFPADYTIQQRINNDYYNFQNTDDLPNYWDLPKTVLFCKNCTYSNQIPSSFPEFKHTLDRICPTLPFNEEGVCDACRYNERMKGKIDWIKRENELLKLLDRYRKDDGRYDCIVPGSGGKDSAYQAHILKYKYGMHPLTITWPPIMYTDYGKRNFDNWIDIGGFDNVTYRPNGIIHKLLTKLSILNILHPFQSFILGQKGLASKLAMKFDIPLIFYGENDAEYNNPIADNQTSLRDKSFHTINELDNLHIGGVSIAELKEKHGLNENDLSLYLPADYKEFEKHKIEVHFLGYYLKWTPQEVYYYAVENTGFAARPFRTQGTYSKYNSIDDKIDDLHYYTTFIKFGIGRATYDAAQEIRNSHITLDEGKALVNRFDGEFPDKYFDEIMDYLDIDKDSFIEVCDHFRSPHIWANENGDWKLRHNVNGTGVND